MLRMSGSLLDQAIMSIRSGLMIGVAKQPVIDPRNLKILGWWCRVGGNRQLLVLLAEDVREMMPQGFAVNDEHSLSLPTDLHRHREILANNFQLLGKPVKTKRRKLGKVADFSYEDGSMFVQKLYVGRSLIKIFTNDDTVIIDRRQIIEVTDQYILVEDTEIKDTSEETVPAAATISSA